MSLLLGTLLTLGQLQGGPPPVVPPTPNMIVAPQQGMVLPQQGGVIVTQPAPVAVPLSSAKSLLCRLAPGPQRITFVHPYTCCPVTVCFCLPFGCYEIECGKGLLGAEKLRFEFKKNKDVVIKFHKDGTVTVKD